jgi:hypothetical protein
MPGSGTLALSYNRAPRLGLCDSIRRGSLTGPEWCGRRRNPPPETEMGPALLPTPLSPACGSRRILYARRFANCPKAAALSPGARAGAGSVGGWLGPKTFSVPPGGSATVLSTRLLNWFGNAGHRLSIKAGRQVRPPTARPRGFNGLEVTASGDALAFIPPPRGISPSRRARFQNLFFYQGVTPSIRRANPRSRWIEDARDCRVGQDFEGPVIHFQEICRWTRVDNSTSRRMCRRRVNGRAPGPFGRAAEGVGR